MENEKPKGNAMEKLATLIVDKRNLIFLLYIFALIFCVIATGWVNVENDITPPGAAGCTPVSLTARPDGGLDYIALRPAETPGQYTYTHFYSADSGKEWTENTMDWQESFGEKRQIEKVTVTPEGEYFVMLTEQTEDGMGAVAYARVAADGTAAPVQPEGLSAQGGLMAADAQVLPGGRLLLTSFGGDFAAAQNGAAGATRRRKSREKSRTARKQPP